MNRHAAPQDPPTVPEPASTAHPDSGRAARAGMAAVALLAVVVYANALANGYVLDDEPIILFNPVVHGLGNLGGVLFGPYWPEIHQMYRPVTMLSFAVQWAVHGDAAWAFHLVNVLLHAGATALLYALVLRLGGGVRAAVAGAAVFAVHPVHVEAVSNIVGRAEMLATIFYLAACLVHLREGAATPRRIWTIAGLYLLALGSKEIAVTLPAALLLADALRSRGRPWSLAGFLRGNARLLAALAATFAGFMLLRMVVLGDAVGAGPASYLAGVGAGRRLALAARLWPEYLRLLFWPRDLSAEWAPDTLTVPTWSDPAVWASLALVIALAAAAAATWKRQRWVSVAILWFAIVIFPVSHVVFRIGVLLAERTLYLPSAALAFLAPPLVGVLAREKAATRRLAVAATAVLLALAAARTWTRTPVWKSFDTSFGALVREHPEVWRVDMIAGQVLFSAGRGAEATRFFDQALEKTNYSDAAMVEQYTLWLLVGGEARRAEAVLRRALVSFPDAPVASLYLARALFDQGRYREAIAVTDHMRQTRYGRAWAAETQHVSSLAHDALGARGIAAAQNDSALANPRWAKTAAGYFHRARLRALQGDTARAAAALRTARELTPAAFRPLLVLRPLPPPTHPAMRGWVYWGVDGTVGGLQNVRPRAFTR